MKQQKRIETYLGAALGTYRDLHDVYSREHTFPITSPLDGKVVGRITANLDLQLGLEAFMHHYVLFECQAETPGGKAIESSSSVVLGSEDIYFRLEDIAQDFKMQLSEYRLSAEGVAKRAKKDIAERSERLKDALKRLDSAKGTGNYGDTLVAVEDIDELANWRTEVDIGKLHNVLKTLKQPAEMLAGMGIREGKRLVEEIAGAYNSLRWFMMERFDVLNPEGVYKGNLDLESIAVYIHGTAGS